MLMVYTSHTDYPGPSRLDVTKGAFAPLVSAKDCLDWKEFVDTYVRDMRISFKNNRGIWDLVLSTKKIVFVCNCRDNTACHRSVLTKIFLEIGRRKKLDIRYYGEISEWDFTVDTDPVYTIKEQFTEDDMF